MIENVTGHGQSRPRSRRGAEGQGAGPETGRAIRLCSGRGAESAVATPAWTRVLREPRLQAGREGDLGL